MIGEGVLNWLVSACVIINEWKSINWREPNEDIGSPIVRFEWKTEDGWRQFGREIV